MEIDEDTCDWLGLPTPLEMYKHHCSMIEGELACVQVQLRKARENIAGLVQMNDLLMTGKAEVEARLAKALEKIGTLEHQYSLLVWLSAKRENYHRSARPSAQG